MTESAVKTEEKQSRWTSAVKYKNVTEQLTTSLVYFFFSVLFEIVTAFCITGKFPSFFWFGLAFMTMLSIIIFVLPNRWLRKTVAILLLAAQVTIAITNDILFNCTGEVFTFDKLLLASEGLNTLDTSLINFWHISGYLLLFAVAVTAMFLLPKYVKKWVPNVKNFMITLSVYGAVFLSVFGVCSGFYSKQRMLWLSEFPSTLAYNTYGYYGFYVPNCIKFVGQLVTKSKLSEKEKTEYLAWLQEGETPVVTDYTGLSEGNNLIVMLAESFDFAAIDPYFTPNLYKMCYEDGVLLENYHSENKTNMSEGQVMFGTYSHVKALNTSVEMAEVAKYTSLPFLLERQAEENGEEIQTGYYHALRSSFYNRDLTFNQVGYDTMQFANWQVDELNDFIDAKGESYHWSVYFYDIMKDSDFFEYNMEQMIPDSGRFFTYYTTLVTHGKYALRGSNTPYYETLTSDENAEKLEQMLDNMEAQGFSPRKDGVALDAFLIYKAAVMDYDKMIGLMFDRLEATGNLDNTTIVMYPDHNSYFSDVSYNLRGIYGSDVRNCNVPAYKLGACIYDRKLAAKLNGVASYGGGATIDKFCSVNDMYPTICDLFNLPYNTNWCYGQSIFCDTPSIFLSLKDDRYIFDDNFYYFNGKIYALNPEDEIDSSYFDELVKEVLYKFKAQEAFYADKSTILKYLQEKYEIEKNRCFFIFY